MINWLLLKQNARRNVNDKVGIMECEWSSGLCEKGFDDYFKEVEADIFCVQETKLQEGQIVLEQGEEYYQYWNYAVKKGIQAQLYSPKSSRSL